MNIRKDSVYLLIYFFTLAAFVPAPARAQSTTAAQPVESRLLLVFDTSSAMKKRLPNVEKSVSALFAVALNGQFRPGDSIGVWTFSRDLHTGEFPLQQWEPDDVLTIPGDINEFLKVQHYSKETSFDELVPMLDQVIHESPRLTVIIFCDGEGQIKGTPADATINALFKQHYHDMKKARMPFVIVLRSQFGRYVGCTVNSAASINLPSFPALPAPAPLPKPSPPALHPRPPAPPPPPPAPLIIIGSTRETNVPPASPQQHAPAPVPSPAPSPRMPPVPPAVSPPPAIPLIKTNQPPSATISTPTAPTATAVASSPEIIARPVAPATAAAAPLENHGKGNLTVLAAGIAAAGAVLGWIFSRLFRRRASPSLITESLKKR